MKRKLLPFIASCCVWGNVQGATFVIPENGDIVGEIQYASAEPGDTVDEIAQRFDIGYNELIRANPKIDPARSLPANTQLIIPLQFILPAVPRRGIVINLADYRLYYFPENENVVMTFPVGIGREGWKTPLGLTKVVAKEANPKWRPTANVQAEAMKHGDALPDLFPSGPYNPLGRYALRLGWPTFLIHGTNRSDGIGARVSAGCLRLFPDDIEQLFKIVPIGTPVRVINEPVKVGMQEGALFLQLHPLLAEEQHKNLKALVQKQLQTFNVANWDKNKAIQNELAYPSGLVQEVNG